jgi:hypothetical protein
LSEFFLEHPFHKFIGGVIEIDEAEAYIPDFGHLVFFFDNFKNLSA